MQVFVLKIETVKLENDPILNRFKGENSSIQTMVEGSYYATVRQQGLAYEILCDGEVVGYYMIKVGAIRYENDDFSDSSDLEYGAIVLKYIIIDKQYRHKGIGTAVMRNLALFTKTISLQLPIRFLFLDALTEYQDWYEKIGFFALTTSNISTGPTVPMIMDFINREQLERYIQTYID